MRFINVLLAFCILATSLVGVQVLTEQPAAADNRAGDYVKCAGKSFFNPIGITWCAAKGGAGVVGDKVGEKVDEKVDEAIEGAKDAAGDVYDDTLSGWVDSLNNFIGGILEGIIGLTIGRASFLADGDLCTDGTNGGWWCMVRQIQYSLYWIAAMFVFVGIMWHALRMVWNKSGVPIADLIKAIGTFVFVSAAGVTVVQMASAASDALAQSLVGGNIAEDINVSFRFTTGEYVGNVVELLWLILISLGLLFQTFVILMKDLGVVLASGLLVVAASGQFFSFSKTWLDKILGLVIGLILYKPLLALSLSIGLQILDAGQGTTGEAPKLLNIIVGGALVVLTAFGVSPMVKMFSQLNYSGGIGQGGTFGSGAIHSGTGAPGGVGSG